MKLTAYFLRICAACFGALLFSALSASAQNAPAATLGQSGIALPCGQETLTLSWPLLAFNDGRERIAPEAVSLQGSSASLSYPGGGKARITASAGAIAFSFDAAPAGLKAYRFDLHIPMTFAEGGTWRVGDRSGAFPREKPTPNKLYQGNAGTISFAPPGDGAPLFLRFPESFGWLELQDYREWNWEIFGCSSTTPYNADKRVVVVAFDTQETRLETHRRAAETAYFAAQGNTKKPVAEKPSLEVALTGGGLRLRAGSMGEFTLSHPRLNLEGVEGRSKPVETRVDGDRVRLAYKTGGVLNGMLDRRNRRITYTFEKKPAGLKGRMHEMFIPFNYNQGGAWEVDGAGKPFPAVKGGAKLFQGHGRELVLQDPNRSRLGLSFPAHTYIEVQDNREWNWNIFWSSFMTPGNADSFSVDYALDVSAWAQRRLVDEFGQVPRDWPGKITSAEALLEDAQREEALYRAWADAFADPARAWTHGGTALHPARRSVWGGLDGAGKALGLSATGFFHVEKKTVGGRERWLLVDPAGEPFFHLGICCFGASDDYTDVTGRRAGFAWLPPHEGPFAAAWKDKPGDWWHTRAVSFYKANVIRKYGAWDEEAQARRHIARVRAVGFNSGGAFSARPAAMREARFPHVATLPTGGARPLPNVRGLFDPFDPETPGRLDAAFAKALTPHKDDPLLIGYYIANEQGLEDIPTAIPALNGTYAAKRELVAFLRRRYGGDIAAFTEAWKHAAPSFEALTDIGLPVATRAAAADMSAFTERLLDRYYRLVHDTFRRYDPNHLLIGSRWQPGTANNEILCRVAGRYLDVVSINYYTAAIDRAFVSRLYEWTGGKPQFWSEFYYTASRESNNAPSSNDLPTQRERGLAYRNYVEGAADLGFVVGVEWFTLIDQAPTGRFFEGQNGERNNTGLFNVLDRPYRDLFDGMLEANANVYRVWFGDAEPYRFEHPRFQPRRTDARRTVSAGRPVGPMSVDGMQSGYPGRPPELISADRIVSGTDDPAFNASFKVAWDDAHLYLLVAVRDATPFCADKSLPHAWNGDCIELFLGHEAPEQGGPLLASDRQILLRASPEGGAYVPHATVPHNIRTAVIPAADGAGYTLEAAIPWATIDFTPKENAKLLFDLAVDNADPGEPRSQQLMWNGTHRNSSDRSAWGLLHLVP